MFKKLNSWAVERQVQGLEFQELARRGRLVCELFDLDLSEKDFSDTVAAVLDNLEVVLGSGSDVTAGDFKPWFASWREENGVPRWDRYADHLVDTKGWAGEVVSGLDQETSHLIDLAGDPNVPGEWARRGLVIGEVQSGKTANYIGVLNKAMDVGFKIVIVLGGHTNDLRRQTQERVDSDLLGFDTNYSAVEISNSQNSRVSAAIGVGRMPSAIPTPSRLTSVLGDFSKSNKATQGVTVGTEPVVGVVKKHAGTLKNLTDFLRHQSRNGRLTAPLIVIDDESDWASVNTGTEEKVVAVNRAIRDLLAVSTRSSYMAITATPFANILIDSAVDDDLFPKDYIRGLPSPSNYMGVEHYHSDEARDENPHRLQTDVDDALKLLPYNHKGHVRLKGLPKSLEEAILAFYVGTAVRRLRDGKAKPASMMVNLSRFNAVQENVHDLVADFAATVSRTLKAELPAALPSESPLLTRMQDVLARTYPSVDLNWEALRSPLVEVAEGMRTALVNAKTTKDIEKHINSLSRDEREEFMSRPVIQVGGNVLARGLTLEGLQVSYFVRKAGAADTLLQMGRWFGYRPKYDDLVRVWIDEDVVELFAFTAEVSADLRASLAELKRLKLTPADFGLRIKLHPEAFRITAANKSKHGEVVHGDVSIHGALFASTVLPSQAERRAANLAAAGTLFNRLTEGAGNAEGDFVWRAVPSSLIEDFFAEFKAADEDPWMGPSADGKTSQIYNALGDAVNGDFWDVKFVNGAGKKTSLPGSNGVEIAMSKRNATEIIESGSLRLGNRRLASGDDLLGVLPPDARNRVQEAYDAFREATSPERPGSLTETFVAREGLERPVLLVYTLSAPEPKERPGRQLTEKDKRVLEGPLTAALVAFPRLPEDDERRFSSARVTRFMANTVYQQLMYAEVDDDLMEED
ncbi:MAG: Z1 domain-containing protein [Micrococcus sp.]|nr:Z1 domain-containing protein [Micrococcus sp.]